MPNTHAHTHTHTHTHTKRKMPHKARRLRPEPHSKDKEAQPSGLPLNRRLSRPRCLSNHAGDIHFAINIKVCIGTFAKTLWAALWDAVLKAVVGDIDRPVTARCEIRKGLCMREAEAAHGLIECVKV